MTLATLQQLRSFNEGEHPLNLEPGQIAFNMAYSYIDSRTEDINMFMYVGNGASLRLDENGTVLASGGLAEKGWVRYRMRNVSNRGDNVYGDLNILGAKLKVESTAGTKAELVIPKETSTPANGSEAGSVRWNTSLSILEAWNGAKWDTTSKVFVSAQAPVNPSNGDMWLVPGPPSLLYVYVVPSIGPAEWIQASSGADATALQPGNGVESNALNQIELIDSSSY